MAPAETAHSERPPPVGFVYDDYPVEVSADWQRQKLACCDVDPDIWGDYADPSFFAMFTTMAQVWSGRSINGNVHMSQVYRMKAGLPVGETLNMCGSVTRIDPHPRGEVVYADFGFRTGDGALLMEADRSSLNPGVGDPNAPRRSLPPIDLGAMTVIHEMTMEPEKVAAFSGEAANLIHSDPETAQRFGFRAPIAGGLMASHIMLGALGAEAGGKPVTSLEGEIRFLRPMFWDDRLRLFATAAGDAARELALVGDDDKPRCRASIAAIGFG